jgi:transposase
MEQFIGCDAHKKFSVFVAVNEKGHAGEALRVTHDRQLYREFLARLPEHSSIAVEASGSYSWLADEMERSGHRPKLSNPLEAKRRMGLTKKTDTLDARGLADRATLDRQPSLFTNVYNLPLTHCDSSLRLSL